MPDSLKENITVLSRDLGIAISHRKIASKVNAALKLEGEARNKALKECYIEISMDVAGRAADIRALRYVDVRVNEKYKNINNTMITPNKIMRTIGGIIAGYVNEKTPEMQVKATFDTTPEERLELIRDDCSTRHSARLLDMYAKSATGAMLLDELAQYKEDVKDGVFSPEAQDQKINRQVGALYLKYKTKQEQMKGHGRIWRFFHRTETKNTQKFFRETEELFNKVGFDIEKHAEAVMEYHSTLMPQPIDTDLSDAKQACEQAKEAARLAERKRNTKQLTVATQKYKDALKRDKEPATAFHNKLESICSKYGIDPKKDPMKIPVSAPLFASDYDTMRELGNAENCAKEGFLINYRKLLNAAVKQNIAENKPINVSEIAKDAQMISTMMLENYTAIFDVPETQEMLNGMVLGCLSPEQLKEQTVRELESNRANRQRAADEKNIPVVTDTVDVEACGAEAESFAKEYLSNAEKNLAAERAAARENPMRENIVVAAASLETSADSIKSGPYSNNPVKTSEKVV